MKITLCLIAALLISLFPSAGAETPQATPEDIATQFLRDLEKSKVDDALKLCANGSLNQRQKDRIARMSAKIVAAGGIKKIQTPPVEKRPKNLASHEVVVIVSYANKDLAFGSISFVEDKGQFKISNIRSEQGWGGTTSLFDEPTTGATTPPEE